MNELLMEWFCMNTNFLNTGVVAFVCTYYFAYTVFPLGACLLKFTKCTRVVCIKKTHSSVFCPRKGQYHCDWPIASGLTTSGFLDHSYLFSELHRIIQLCYLPCHGIINVMVFTDTIFIYPSVHRLT